MNSQVNFCNAYSRAWVIRCSCR